MDFAFLIKPDNVRYYNLHFNLKKETKFILNKFLNNDDLNLGNGKTKYRIVTNKGLTVASALKASMQGPVLIFVPHKHGNTGVDGIVNEIKKQISLINTSMLLEKISNNIIDDLIDYFSLLFGADYQLVEALQYGILYHHGDFPQFIREIIEDLIDKAGFKLIVCTNTLIEGVNLPIKTIVIYSTKRYNYKIEKYEDLSLRELRNLVGRAGRAGKETRGLIIVPNKNDFNNIHEVMNESNKEMIYGNLYNIIRPITQILIKRNLKLDDSLLVEIEEKYPDIIDSIDISLLELLSEEVGSDELMNIVLKLVSSTYSFFQSNEDEKNTLTKMFLHRTDKLIPYIKTNDFKVIKGSNTSVSEYEEINRIFDFGNEIWYSNNEALSENWLSYILDKGVFKLGTVRKNFDENITIQRAGISFEKIKIIMIYWMKGTWYNELARIVDLSVDLILELMNTVLQFQFQKIIFSVIRIAELKNEDKPISQLILNWPKMFQYGLDSQLKLDLLELGLNDRVAILFLNEYCISEGYIHQSKSELKQYIKKIKPFIYGISPLQIPGIAFNNLINFINKN